MAPDSAHCYYERGYTKHEAKMYVEAIADFSQALRLKPAYSAAYNNRGICYLTLENFEMAAADFHLAIRYDPKNARAYNNRGIALIKMGLTDKGCEDLNKAYDLGDRKSWDNIKKYCTRKKE